MRISFVWWSKSVFSLCPWSLTSWSNTLLLQRWCVVGEMYSQCILTLHHLRWHKSPAPNWEWVWDQNFPSSRWIWVLDLTGTEDCGGVGVSADAASWSQLQRGSLIARKMTANAISATAMEFIGALLLLVIESRYIDVPIARWVVCGGTDGCVHLYLSSLLISSSEWLGATWAPLPDHLSAYSNISVLVLVGCKIWFDARAAR